MARAESRAKIIEDATTGDNLAITSDGSIYSSDRVSKWLTDGKVFIASSSVTFAGTSFEEKILFRNPSGSGKTAVILGFNIHMKLGATTNQLNQQRVRIHKNPTITTNGSAVAENNLNSSASDSASCIVNTDPTLSANGKKIGEGSSINATFKTSFPYLVTAGTSVLVRIAMNDAANSAIFNIAWAEI